MTDYADVPKVNALHAEAETIGRAIDSIDNGGTLATMVIGPPPPPPGAPGDPMVMMSSNIIVPPGSADAQLMADIRNWLVERQNQINSELAALGVTAAPPARGAPKQ